MFGVIERAWKLRLTDIYDRYTTLTSAQRSARHACLVELDTMVNRFFRMDLTRRSGECEGRANIAQAIEHFENFFYCIFYALDHER